MPAVNLLGEEPGVEGTLDGGVDGAEEMGDDDVEVGEYGAGTLRGRMGKKYRFSLPSMARFSRAISAFLALSSAARRSFSAFFASAARIHAACFWAFSCAFAAFSRALAAVLSTLPVREAGLGAVGAVMTRRRYRVTQRMMSSAIIVGVGVTMRED